MNISGEAEQHDEVKKRYDRNTPTTSRLTRYSRVTKVMNEYAKGGEQVGRKYWLIRMSAVVHECEIFKYERERV